MRTIERLIEIAAQHFGDKADLRRSYVDIADALYGNADGNAPPVSTAEYLDTVRACHNLKVKPKNGDPVWDSIVRATIRKPTSTGERS